MEEGADQLVDIVSGNGEANDISIAEDDCDEEADDVPVDSLIEEVQREEVRHPVGKGRCAPYPTSI